MIVGLKEHLGAQALYASPGYWGTPLST